MVEQRPFKALVDGSSPSQPTYFPKNFTRILQGDTKSGSTNRTFEHLIVEPVEHPVGPMLQAL